MMLLVSIVAFSNIISTASAFVMKGSFPSLPRSSSSFSDNVLRDSSSSSVNDGDGEIIPGNSTDSNNDTNNDEREAFNNKRFEQMTKDLFGDGQGRPPQRPPSSLGTTDTQNVGSTAAAGGGGSGKGSLYSDDELMNLLSTHNRISDQLVVDNGDDRDNNNNDPNPFSLHDLVLSAVENDDTTTTTTSTVATTTTSQYEHVMIPPSLQQKQPHIRAIASDVDGTLLSGGTCVHPRTLAAVQKAVKLSSSSNSPFYFFPATGKSRRGALDSLGPELAPLLANVPGVYVQGLYCVDAQGHVLFERKLPDAVVDAAKDILLATDDGLAIVGYDGDDLYTTDATSTMVRTLHEYYGEPMAVEVPTLVPPGGGSLHKLLFLHPDPDQIDRVVRPQLEALAAQYDVCVTQAIPTMLELLPAGCNKARGVRAVCDHLGIDVETELLTLGDAENDAEMLREASIGVAMGNGCPVAKESADYVMKETNAEGAAGMAMELFGFLNNDE